MSKAPQVEASCIAPIGVETDDHLRVNPFGLPQDRHHSAPFECHLIMNASLRCEISSVGIILGHCVAAAETPREPAPGIGWRAAVQRLDPQEEKGIKPSPSECRVG